MTRAELDHYARTIDLRLDLAAICNSTAEIDAAKEADDMVQQYTLDYYMTKTLAPHNLKRSMEKFKEIIDSAKDGHERDLLLSEWRGLSLLDSEVKRVKKEALAIATVILSDAKIGKKRIKKMIPILTDTLLDDEDQHIKILRTPNFIK